MDQTTGNSKTVRNSERAERRRSVIRSVRDERERLMSISGTRPAFDYELGLTFARNRLSAAYAPPLLIIIVACAAMLWIDLPTVALWAGAALAVHFGILALCRRYVDLPTSAISIRSWVGRFVVAEFISGCVWAILFLLMPQSPADNAGLDVFQFATMLVVVSVTTSLASTVPIAALAGTMPVTLTLVAIFASRGGILFYVLASMALAAEVFFIILASRLYQATLQMVEFRAEKDMLIAELGTAKAMSDEARRQAEEANLAKSRFLATMSHELRTPLNAILGFSEIIKNEVLGPIGSAHYRDYVSDIHASGQHLLNLINEILDLSRVEAGRYELTEEPVNLAGIAEESVRLLQLKAKAKNIAIREVYVPNLPKLWADERAVRQITLNLLSNAMKFTPNGGEVTVKVGWTGAGAQFLSIRDNGPGIPPDEIPIVLSAFGQGAIAIKSAERGAGLGLSIVQALMQTHEGTFELKSKLREGTEAICVFPQSRVMEALAPIVPPRQGNSWLRAG